MEILWIVIAVLLLIGGVIGCLLPVLPGAPLSYAGLLLLHFTGMANFTNAQLVVWLLFVIVLQVLDYLTPILGSKYSGGTEFGNRGCFAGTIIGLLFMPWGIIVGPFIGAVLGELLGGRRLPEAIRAGVGSLLGFLVGTMLKIVVCFYFLVQGIAVLV